MLEMAVTSGFWKGDVLTAIKLDGFSTCLLRLESEVSYKAVFTRGRRENINNNVNPVVNNMVSNGCT